MKDEAMNPGRILVFERPPVARIVSCAASFGSAAIFFMYLAEHPTDYEALPMIGLILLFLGTVAAWFVQTIGALRGLDEERASWVLGCQAGVVAALAVGLADHYFFNIEFSHMVALFWGVMGLGAAIVALPPAGEGAGPPGATLGHGNG